MTNGSAPTQHARFVATRGGEPIDERTLKAHLAALLRLENVALFLGAGASSGEVGGLTLKDTWTRFCDRYSASRDWLREARFIDADAAVSIEALADALEVARMEWERTGQTGLEHLLAASADLQRVTIDAALLSRGWWDDPSAVEDPSNSLQAHRTVVQKVCAARQPGQPAPWFFTTNYDLAIEWAAESLGLHVTNGFGGLHWRAFAAHNFDLGFRNVLARGEARFGTYNICLAKLHGSLTWRLLASRQVVEDSATAMRERLYKFLSSTGGEPEALLVYPRSAKFRQTTEYVLGELFRRFTETLSRPQTGLLVCGYSFGDEHLNRVLRAALNNPTLQLILYVPEASWHGDDLVVDAEAQWPKRIANLKLPQVTIVGGGSVAWFAEMARHLPDPTVLDPHASEIRRQLREWESWERADAKSQGDAI